MSSFREDLDRYDHKDLYDFRDPHIYMQKYGPILYQTMGATLHEIWCEWAASMISQNLIESSKVSELVKLLVPFHALPPDSQRDQLIRAEKLVNQFIQWKLIENTVKRGEPKKGRSNV